MNLAFETRSEWCDLDEKQFYLYRSKDDDLPIKLGVNDSIIWEGRDSYVKITEVIGYPDESGPRGFVYLPWREDGRWASPMYSFRGNPRCVICYPEGFPNYGLHIGLHTIEKDDAPPASHLERPYYMDTMVELRYYVNKFTQGKYTVNDNVYKVSMDTFEYEVHLFREDKSHVADLRFISGCKKSFVEHTRLYECM
jgi:hypothetical protein